MVNTRSGKKYGINNDLARIKVEYAEEVEVEEKEKEAINHLKCDIDFDDAHSEWMKNKKRVHGHYVYICGKETKSGKICKRARSDKIGFYSGCRIHYGWEEKECKYE